MHREVNDASLSTLSDLNHTCARSCTLWVQLQKSEVVLCFVASERGRRFQCQTLDSEEVGVRLLPYILESFQLYSRYHLDDEEAAVHCVQGREGTEVANAVKIQV